MDYQMLNNNILCKDVTNTTNVSKSGFEDQKQLFFKEVEILLSSDDRIKVGSIAKVRSTAGDKIELKEGDFLVISVGEVILLM